MKKLFILSLTLLGLFLNSLFLNAENRVALVIGNSNYSKGYLSNPQNDAAAIAEKLKKLNFKVIPVINGNLRSMNNAISSFKELIELNV